VVDLNKGPNVDAWSKLFRRQPCPNNLRFEGSTSAVFMLQGGDRRLSSPGAKPQVVEEVAPRITKIRRTVPARGVPTKEHLDPECHHTHPVNWMNGSGLNGGKYIESLSYRSAEPSRVS
jgi:hypothetical protein